VLHVITDAGREVLSDNPPIINGKYLEQFNSFREFVQKQPKATEQIESAAETPEEILQSAYEQIAE
jgi:restriction system protein